MPNTIFNSRISEFEMDKVEKGEGRKRLLEDTV